MIQPSVKEFKNLCRTFAKQTEEGIVNPFVINQLHAKYQQLSNEEKVGLFAIVEGVQDFKRGPHVLSGLSVDSIVEVWEDIINKADESEFILAIAELNELKVADPVPYAKLQKLKGTTLFLDIANKIDDSLAPHP